MRALAAAGQAALAVNSATTANIAEALLAAESGAAGLFLTPHRAIYAQLTVSVLPAWTAVNMH